MIKISKPLRFIEYLNDDWSGLDRVALMQDNLQKKWAIYISAKHLDSWQDMPKDRRVICNLKLPKNSSILEFVSYIEY
jgi:hypothetical protein